MMIHDCSIVDGQGNNHTVIDTDGLVSVQAGE
ncbi:unnamed protein product [Nippostrongylus brasiliensis]|uniref:Phage tail protein n=1 Tax=Nippostrongylus brasiliensis TaxID=27835 RepID=A0A0N4Y279_NIPBR|nr:unnamed protein product [Nippostrongylus brasiliensis]